MVMIINKKSQVKIAPILLISLVLVGIFLTSYFVLAESPQEQSSIVHTSTTDKICNGDVCTVILYSGIRNVYENGQWKRVEDTKSLKEVWDIVFLENDPNFLFNNLDYNYTSIWGNLSFDGNWEDYPEFCYEKLTGDVSCTFKLEKKWREWNEQLEDFEELEIEFEYEWEFEDGIVTSDKNEFKIEGNPLGKTFKFGGNSTTIQLQDADSENLEDVSFYETDGWFGGTFIKFNISSLQGGQTINNVSLALYYFDEMDDQVVLDSDTTFKNLNNQTWNETDNLNDTYNSGLSGEVVDTDFIPDSYGWAISDDIKSLFLIDYNAGNPNFSVYLYDPDFTPTNFSKETKNGDEIFIDIGRNWGPLLNRATTSFYSKEYATDITLRPYLNITYSVALPTVTLISPTDIYVSNQLTQQFTCNSTVLSDKELSNVTFSIWNSTGSEIFTNFTNISGTSNLTILIGNVTDDGVYNWNCKAVDNESLFASASSNFTFTLETDFPAINLESPTDNTYFDNGINIYFNFTSTDSDGLDTCELWGNWTGIWHNNYTWVGPISGVQNYTTLNLTDVNAVWNIWCNDTIGAEGFAPFNFTVTIDTIYPTLSIDDISTTPGSQTLTITNTVEDTNLDSCKYSIFDSTGSIDGLNDNVSFICNSSFQATVTAYASYNLTIYAIDLASNENSTTTEFTVTEAGVTIGGGGIPIEVEKIPTIILKQIIGDKIYNELERAVFYARINTFCSIKITTQTLAIQDFSGECSLRKSDIEKIREDLFKEGFQIPVNDLILFYEKYSARELEQAYMTLDVIKTYDLFTSVLGITNPMRVNPPRLDRPFIIFGDGNFTIEYVFVVNKKVKECSIISGEGFECEVITDNSVKMILNINDTDFLDKIFQGEMSITSDADPQNLEVKRISLFPRVYNLSYKIMGIPAIVLLIMLGSLILMFSVFFIIRGRIRKKLKRGKS